MSEELLRSALDLASLGLRIFPLKPGTKVPAVKDWPNLATTDEGQIREVWGNGHDWNIGVAMGGGFLGVDIDVKGGKPGLASAAALGVPLEGMVVVTPSGGKHVYFRGPDVRNSAGSLGAGLDIRGSGGYLVGPGSVVDGQAYVVESHEALLEAPASLLASLGRAPERGRAPAVSLDRPDAVGRAIDYLVAAAPTATEGLGGDHTTFLVAAHLKDIGVGQEMAVDLMAEHWNDRCSPPWDIEDLKTKVHNAYAYGTLQPGLFHPAYEFAGVQVEPPPPAAVEPTRWFRHGDSFNLDTNWLFYETLPATGVAVLVAPTGAGKTFLSIELARALATGKPFFKLEPDDKGATLFVFAGTEGSGFARRLAALGEDKPLPISATSCGNLAERNALDNLLTALKAEAEMVKAKHGVPVRLIVLETLAASGLVSDENDNAEASRAMANLAQISRAMGALVLTSHHPSKTGHEARGASAIPSSADYVLTIRREGKSSVRELALTKARDAEERQVGSFTLLDVDLGTDPRGRPIKSMTVSTGAPATNATRAAPHAQVFRDALDWALMEADETIIDGCKAVEMSEVRETFRERKPGSTDKSNVSKAFNAALSYLESLGAIEVVPYDGAKYIKLRGISGIR